MMYSGDEYFGDDVTSGIFPDEMREPEDDDTRDDWGQGPEFEEFE